MGISCACSASDEGEYPEFFFETFPKARKKYTCCECGEMILPGSIYQRCYGKWDGHVDTFKTCMACYNIRKYYFSGRCSFESLREEIRNCLGFNYTEVSEDEED